MESSPPPKNQTILEVAACFCCFGGEGLPWGRSMTLDILPYLVLRFRDDRVDSSGQNRGLDLAGTLHKRDLGPEGLPAEDWVAPPGACMPCYEAQEVVEAGECCNTCLELKEAYSLAGLSYYHILKQAEQCSKAVGCEGGRNSVAERRGWRRL